MATRRKRFLCLRGCLPICAGISRKNIDWFNCCSEETPVVLQEVLRYAGVPSPINSTFPYPYRSAHGEVNHILASQKQIRFPLRNGKAAQQKPINGHASRYIRSIPYKLTKRQRTHGAIRRLRTPRRSPVKSLRKAAPSRIRFSDTLLSHNGYVPIPTMEPTRPPLQGLASGGSAMRVQRIESALAVAPKAESESSRRAGNEKTDNRATATTSRTVWQEEARSLPATSSAKPPGSFLDASTSHHRFTRLLETCPASA